MDELIRSLAADARPVKPLAPPSFRAVTTLALFAVAAGMAIAMSDTHALLTRYAGREAWLALEMIMLLAAGLLAVTAAFFAAVPGRSTRWGGAAVPFFLAWLSLSGAGCYADHASGRSGAWTPAESVRCFLFIIGTSAVIAIPTVWRLSRAAPLDAMKVALLAGLGVAVLSVFLLYFFHPFGVTPLDLVVHLAAIALVTTSVAMLRRRALRPA